jgi:indolepyruvate ferredoxin oxidoreductase beta subunit
MDKSIYNILLSGVGGQGILVASQILAEAALAAGYDVKKAEVHGMAQRGGSVSSHVRFGEEVYSPLITKHEADFLVAFEPLEALRYLNYLRPGGTVVLNEQKILPQSVRIGDAIYPANIPEICRHVAGEVIAVNASAKAGQLGDRRVVNVFLLGMLSRFLCLPEECWLETIRQRVPVKSVLINHKAFKQGQRLAYQSPVLHPIYSE